MGEVLATAHGGMDGPAKFSDDALALKFTEIYGEDLRYTAPWTRWSRWDGTRWIPDVTLHVFDLARAVCRAAAATTDKPQAARIGSAQTVAAVERLARADRHHAATTGQWDTDPWLLNTPGGVIDLKTGELCLAKRSDYMSKSTAVAPGGDCPLWLSFLCRITGENEGLQRFIQRTCGYAMTGVTFEHAMFFFHGPGGNGKSVLLAGISGALGDYARTGIFVPGK